MGQHAGGHGTERNGPASLVYPDEKSRAAQPPEHQVIAGAVPKIPFVTGNAKDEGTAFSFFTLNIT